MKTHCCLGSYYDVPCTADCPTNTPAERAVLEALERIDAGIANLGNPDTSSADPELLALAAQAIDAVAWRAYARAWPEAMCGYEFYHHDELRAAEKLAAEFASAIQVD